MTRARPSRSPAAPKKARGSEPAQVAHLLDNPVARELLTVHRSHAVLLDAGGRLVACSEDAPAALGLACPVPARIRFPDSSRLNLPAKGLSVSTLPVKVGGENLQLRVFQDLREDLAQEGLLESFFQELQDNLAAMEETAARLETRTALETGLPAFQALLTGLRQKLQTQRRILLPRSPLVQPGTSGLPASTLPDPAAQEDPGAHRDTVLVVDDSTVVLRFLEAILTRENYRVLVAGSSMGGLALAFEHRPDLILLDAVMPDLNGFQVCSRLKADSRTRDIPVLFVTALRSEADEVLALEAGAIDFIPKPIIPATVLARVRNHLELKHSKDRLLTLSFIDGLTGVANRRQFDQSLDVEWHRCERGAKPLSLVMGDVDLFKAYNDHFGHAAGDECLRRVAQVFQASLRRAGDLAARFGGEEFACILPGTDREGARLVADQIQRKLAALNLHHPKPGASQAVTVSLGVATAYPPAPGNPRSLLDEADQNLYEAKRRGRNRIMETEPGERPLSNAPFNAPRAEAPEPGSRREA